MNLRHLLYQSGHKHNALSDFICVEATFRFQLFIYLLGLESQITDSAIML